MPKIRKPWQESSAQGVLTVLCGPSHSGKSTFVKRYCKGFKVINSDRIRKRQTGSSACSRYEPEVWKTFESQKRKALRTGHNVVLDACHMSERARWHALQGSNDRHKKVCIVFDLPLEAVRQRSLKARRLPLKEVERMWRAFQNSKPTARELIRQGFDEVCFVKGEMLMNRYYPPPG